MVPPDDPPSAALTPDEALQLGISHHRQGELDAAEAIYARVLRRQPRRADAHNFMGMLQFQRGEHARALDLLKRASQLAPREQAIWNNLGNVLTSLGRHADAEKAFRRSLALVESPQALTNIARLQARREEWVRSEQTARRAIALAPEFGEAWHHLSLALLGQRRMDDAFEAAARAEQLLPRSAATTEAFGFALSASGDRERLVAFYRDWLAREPDNPYVQHHLAASLGESSERASDAYVEKVFDEFAVDFDLQLAKLKYCAPELVQGALRAALPAPSAQLAIADLGCGTGLCGPLVKPWARSLVGCDLSARMLERAARRGVYDAVVKAELVQFMADRPGAFDVLVSADTLIYFGELGQAFAAAHAALRPGGTLCFTLESLPEDSAQDQRLTESGRYAHTLAGLRRRLAAAGFAEPSIEPVVPRFESGKPVAGWLAIVRRA